jgi:hypothetical protein
MEASTSELLNREPFNPTVVLETEPFVQNIPQNLSKFTRSEEQTYSQFSGVTFYRDGGGRRRQPDY